MDNKFCVNCGNALKDNEKFCGNCGRGIVQNNSLNNGTNTNTPMPIILGIASLILYFIGGIGAFLSIIFIDSINGVIFDIVFTLPFLGIITMIIGRIVYSRSFFLKVVMWIIIAGIVIPILLLVFLIMIGLFMVSVLGVTA